MRCSIVLALVFAFGLSCLSGFAQSARIPGKVFDEAGNPIVGATVRFKNQKGGTITLDDGSFSISSPTGRGTLVISALGFVEQEVDVAGLSQVRVNLVRNDKNLNEVVVTAYGIRRAKNTLPYAAQTISGDEANKVRLTNVAQGLSGKVSGLEIRQNNSVGGSVNVVIRGAKSLTGSNQALFVVDGVPFDNTVTNSSTFTPPAGSSTANPNATASGTGGYDYGNAASDINPDDIASINVLKGAAATALYGSRAANGVIMITTKRGRTGFNIQVNSGLTVGRIDKSTFVKLQNKYGAGRSDDYSITNPPNPPGKRTDFQWADLLNDGQGEYLVNANAPRSWGPAFDPSILVWQWDAFDPSSPNFHKATPWVAAKHGPDYFYGTSISNNNSVYLDGASDKGSFKLGFNRTNDKGNLPNSSVTRNQVNFSGTYKIVPRLTASASANYSGDNAIGRYATGYDADRNVNVQFRQYGQTNVDYKEQKEAYFRHQQNITWSWFDLTKKDFSGVYPAFYNNPYWNAYQNYETDSRSRIFGNTSLNYQITDWLNIMGRISIDNWNQFIEERVAVGSVGQIQTTGRYSRTNVAYQELNYDLLATMNKDLSQDLKFNALLGLNMRRNKQQSTSQTTTGGLIIPNIYAISNSKAAPLAPYEVYAPKAVDGYFAGATLTYRDFLTLDGTFRRDRSSTLPVNANAYNYYGISGSWIFFQHLKNVPWLSSGKLRANYATVGNDAPWGSIQDVYTVGALYGNGSYQFYLPTTKNNPNLKPERTNSKEIGVEVSFLKNRVGLDVTYYHTNSVNQILNTQTSSSVGYNAKYINAGNIENQGFEVSLFGSPVQTRNFSWEINVNWTRNRNKVLSLNEGSTNLVLGSLQGPITINATVGQPYGTIWGTDFQYLNGQRVVSATNGLYVIPGANKVLANANPDWIGGITNTFKYKNLSLSFLVDIRQGGKLFSLDQYYSFQSGITNTQMGLNDRGVDFRLPLAQNGGLILPGVTPDGKANTQRVRIYSNNSLYLPESQFIYDASYIKLRETSINYHLPDRVLRNQKALKGVDLSVFGRNLWIIHKNLPMADPEETTSAGNLQGYQSGSYPAVRQVGLNVKLKF